MLSEVCELSYLIYSGIAINSSFIYLSARKFVSIECENYTKTVPLFEMPFLLLDYKHCGLYNNEIR